MDKAAARITDLHTCPLSDGPKPHVGGPIITGELTVQICGQPAARVGDQATCAGPPDVIATGAPSVWIGNKPAARMTDSTVHLGIITSGCLSVEIGDPASDGWLGGMLAIMCPDDRATLDLLRAHGISITGYDRIYSEDPYYDGTRWTTHHFESVGLASGTSISLKTKQSPVGNAATLYHEGHHTGQPPGWTWPEKEYDAFSAEERWRIARGLPDGSGPGYHFRTTDAAGRTVVNEAEVRRYVNDIYPVASTPSPPGGAPPPIPDQVIGRTPSGDSILQRSDGSTYTRPPRKGDSFSGLDITVPPGGRPVDMSQLRCP